MEVATTIPPVIPPAIAAGRYGIPDSEARFKKSEKIVLYQNLFLSHNTKIPFIRDPWKEWRGFDPAPFGMLILTNKRLLFLFENKASESGLKDLGKAITMGVLKGAAQGFIEGIFDVIFGTLTLGLYNVIKNSNEKKKELNKIYKLEFQKFKTAKSSFAVNLTNINRYHLQKTFPWKMVSSS